MRFCGAVVPFTTISSVLIPIGAAIKSVLKYSSLVHGTTVRSEAHSIIYTTLTYWMKEKTLQWQDKIF